jgi:hypothetical protein
MAREYSQSGRESNGAEANIGKRIPLGTRPGMVAGTSVAAALQ